MRRNTAIKPTINSLSDTLLCRILGPIYGTYAPFIRGVCQKWRSLFEVGLIDKREMMSQLIINGDVNLLSDAEMIPEWMYFAGKIGREDVITAFGVSQYNEYTGRYDSPKLAAAAMGAAEKGRLALVKDLVAKGCGGHGQIYISAAKGGQLPVLRWAKIHLEFNRDDCTALAVHEAVTHGRVNVLGFLLVNCQSAYVTMLTYIAIIAGRTEVLDWLQRRHRTHFPMDVYEFAANSTYINVVNWAIRNHYPLSRIIQTNRSPQIVTLLKQRCKKRSHSQMSGC